LASSWTSQTAWPSGLISSEGFQGAGAATSGKTPGKNRNRDCQGSLNGTAVQDLISVRIVMPDLVQNLIQVANS